MKLWSEIPLGEACRFIDYRGRTPKKTDAGLRLITAKNVRMGFLNREPEEFVAPDSYDSWMTRGIPKQGDVLFTTEAPLGLVCQLDTDEKVVFAQRIITLQTNRERIDPTFLKYALSSPALQNRIHDKATGATAQGIKASLLKKIPVPVPPLPEQERIVAILDEAFEGIATATAHAERNLHNARELFQSVLQSTFEQKGEDWVETTLGSVCENLDSKRVPITKNKRVPGKYPYYGASGVVDYVDGYLFDEELLLVSEDGANLLARTYPIAFSASGKIWVNNHAHVLRFPTIEAQRFMEFYLNSIKLDPYVSGMAQPKLNQKSLNGIAVPAPPLDQQKAIVQKLDALAAETRRLEAVYQRKLDALAELKQSLLQRAFAGEL